MYGKIFESIYNSSIATKVVKIEAELPVGMIIFQQLIVLCDRDGIVDMTPEAIARRINFPVEVVKLGLQELQETDEESRSPLLQGRRIALLEPDHRNWGWLIVNHEYYRNLQTAEDRREYMKKYMKDRRNGETKRAPRKTEYPPNFEKWWEIYPARKGVRAGKEAAFDQWIKAIQSAEDFEQLLRATERYKSVELPKDAERFLKKNYWRDWIPPTVKDIKPGQPPRFKDSDGLVWEMGENGWQQAKA